MKAASCILLVAAVAGSATARPTPTGTDPVSFAGTAHPLSEGIMGAVRSLQYQNVPVGAETVFTTGSSPRTSGGDDVTLAGSNVLLTSMRFGFSTSGVQPNFDARIRLWDTIDVAGNFGGSLLADVRVSFTGVAAGTFLSNPIDLTSLVGGGATVPDNNFGFQISFLNPGTTALVPSDRVTYLFDGTGVNMGWSDDVYWRDVNNDQVIVASESRNFGGGANLANMVLEFEGTPLPAPGPVGLMALAGFAAARRRRA